MYFLGIGVHKRDSYIAVLDENGDIGEEVRVENVNLDAIAQSTQVRNQRLKQLATTTRSTMFLTSILTS